MSKKRSYRMSERAKSQEETRQKIIEATMHLHEEVGPRATTISAIAEKAGVQRLTVYRHFPDETAAFQACTSHWLSINPPPDPAAWNVNPDGWEQLRAALSAFYGYYRSTQRMWTAAHRDVADVPALQQPMAEFSEFLEAIGNDLAEHLDGDKTTNGFALSTIHHALSFPAWTDLDARGVDDRSKVELVELWLRGIMQAGSDS